MKKTEIRNTNTTFPREDLKAGHVILLRNGEFRMVMPVGKSNSLIATDGCMRWNYITNWDEHLCARSFEFAAGFPSEKAHALAREFDIVAVYGFICGTDHYHKVGNIDKGHRDLLWSRVEPKKMTVSEIAEALGYPVEIVEG